MYNFLKIEPQLYKHIKTLYLRCFNVEISIPEIEKKYDTSLFGLRDIGFLALDESNKPAAYYGVFPMILNLNNSDILVAQSGDTMTDPDHQKKGLFVLLANKTYNLAKSVGIEMVFGFPNENSFPGFEKKLNWQFYGNMYRFEIKNFTLPICELVSKYPVLNPYYHLYIKKLLANYIVNLNNFETNSKGSGSIEVKKDRKFFKYKLNNKDNFLINLHGFDMIIKVNNHLIIGDVVFFNKSDIIKFISAIKFLGKILGCRKTIFTMSKKHWLFEYLIDILTAKTSLPIGLLPLNVSEIEYEKIFFIHGDYDTF